MSPHRSIVSTVLIITAVACTSDAPHPLAVRNVEVGNGRVRVHIQFTGDFNLGRNEYPMLLDGVFPLTVPADTGAVIETWSGPHNLDFRAGRTDLWWCEVTGSSSQNFNVASNHTTPVTFFMTCPPLDGNGTLSVKIEAYTVFPCDWWICDFEERHTSELIRVTAERLNGDPMLFTSMVPTWKDMEMNLPPGIYVISAHQDSACGISPDPAFIINRADGWVRQIFSITTC